MKIAWKLPGIAQQNLAQSNRAASSITRWWDPLAALLMMTALITVATRLVVTDWTDDLYITQTVAFLGVIIGLLAGQSRFAGKVVFFIFLIFTAFVIPWQLGMIAGNLEWGERLSVVTIHLINTIREVITSKPVTDNFLFITMMSLLFWILSLHAGYTITRYGAAWQAVLPSGLALLVIQSYDSILERRVWFLAAYLLIGLTLVARLHFVGQRKHWSTLNTHLPQDMGFDWIRFTLIVVGGLTLFAWVAPVSARSIPQAEKAWQYLRYPWVSFQERMSGTFAALRFSASEVSEAYSSRLPLSRGNALSDKPVLKVVTPKSTFSGNRYYWQGYAYDHYQDGVWESTLKNEKEVDPNNTGLKFENFPARQQNSFTITLLTPIFTFYLPSTPIRVNLPAKAEYGVMPDGTVDLAALQSLQSLSSGQSYQAISSISTVTAEQLRSSGSDYTEWIKDHYLQLPGDITPRTRQLAEELSIGLTNPYDIASAITTYLRSYQYQDIIDEHPAGQEVMDWWLFDYKKGFCQYYATAEVILLRSLGIPARYAVGYSQGELVANASGTPMPTASASGHEMEMNGQQGTYLVRERDAHAWPEVYFMGYGWIEFEPTASQTPLVRPSSGGGANKPEPLDPFAEFEHGPSKPDLKNGNNGQSGEADSVESISWPVLPISVLAGSFLMVSLVTLVIKRNPQLIKTPIPLQLESSFIRLGIQPPSLLRRWADYVRLSPVVRSYQEINRALSRLGAPPAPKDTPAERTLHLINMVPATTLPAETLLKEYQAIVYSQAKSAIDGRSAQKAGKEIRKLSYLALLHKWSARFQTGR